MDESGEIASISVTDNGIGFTPDNIRSFETSDSRFKYQRGGKGVGRFIWIKMFETINVDSIVAKGKSAERIRFRFAPEKDQSIAGKKVTPVSGQDLGSTIVAKAQATLW
jgi:signal transduction histidine kinase